tara:strand:- start:7704 stop:8177 length:474 start_codon:yes stop_codon:yes gene_type:complete
MAKQLTLSDSLKAVKVQFDFYCECGVSPNSPYSLEDSDFSPAKDYLEKLIYNNKRSLNYWLNTEALSKAGLREILEEEGFHKSVTDHITDEAMQKHGAIIGYTAGNAEVSRRTMVFAQTIYKDKFGKEYNPIIKDHTKKAGNPDNCMSYQEVKNLLK